MKNINENEREEEEEAEENEAEAETNERAEQYLKCCEHSLCALRLFVCVCVCRRKLAKIII